MHDKFLFKFATAINPYIFLGERIKKCIFYFALATRC